MIRHTPLSTLFPYTTLFRSMLTTGIRSQVGIKVLGNDLKTLEDTSRRIAEVVKTVPGATDVYPEQIGGDRKSTRLNSSHANISYAVFCLNKKNRSRHSAHSL